MESIYIYTDREDNIQVALLVHLQRDEKIETSNYQNWNGTPLVAQLNNLQLQLQ
jgi:hypothetical protein